MKVTVSGRNMDVTDNIRTQVESKLQKYDKFFRSDIEAFATVSKFKGKGVIEVTIPLKNGAIVRAEEMDTDLFTAIDLVVAKIGKQIKKHKTKLEKQYRSHDTIKFEHIPALEENESEDLHEIVKTKSFPIKPMGTEEAILQMELLGHNFFVFLNAETDEVNVVYARKDGKFGLIEPVI